MRTIPSRVSIAVSVGVIATILTIKFLGSVHVSRVYSVAAVYSALPASDTALEDWLKSQRGVIAHTVHVERNNNELHVRFVVSQTLFGGPQLPELLQACNSLGYSAASAWGDDREGEEQENKR